MFVDIAKITVKAGDGGNGAVAFHREKYVASGGPDGGDGGHGGNIIFRVDPSLSTLSDFRYKRKYKAQNGQPGQGSNKNGKKGQDLVIGVPKGTIIKEAETGTILADLSDEQDYVAARGGKGGWGNRHFATPTRQTPRFAKNGMPGEEWDLQLELKLLADVGLLGYPNASLRAPRTASASATSSSATWSVAACSSTLSTLPVPRVVTPLRTSRP